MVASLNTSRPVLDQDARSGQSRIRTLTAATAITQELHDGQTLLMGASGASLSFTLPPATGTGAKYRFVVGVVNTSNYVIQVANSTDVVSGGVIFNTDDASNAVQGFETASTSDTITLNGTTTGGVNIGDWVELQDIKSGFFSVTGLLTGSGTEATPFSAAV